MSPSTFRWTFQASSSGAQRNARGRKKELLEPAANYSEERAAVRSNEALRKLSPWPSRGQLPAIQAPERAGRKAGRGVAAKDTAPRGSSYPESCVRDPLGRALRRPRHGAFAPAPRGRAPSGDEPGARRNVAIRILLVKLSRSLAQNPVKRYLAEGATLRISLKRPRADRIGRQNPPRKSPFNRRAKNLPESLALPGSPRAQGVKRSDSSFGSRKTYDRPNIIT